MLEGRLTSSYTAAAHPSDAYYVYGDAIEPIRITLCWTDPPAATIVDYDNRSPRLIHDLDLLLEAVLAREGAGVTGIRRADRVRADGQRVHGQRGDAGGRHDSIPYPRNRPADPREVKAIEKGSGYQG